MISTSTVSTRNHPARYRVVFYEPNHSGHRFVYLGQMLPGFLALPIEPILATTAAAVRSPEFRHNLARFGDRLGVEPICEATSPAPLRSGLHRLREVIRCTRELQPDHLCIMCADGIWQYLSLGLPGMRLPNELPVEGWFFRGGFTYPTAIRWSDRAKRALFRRLMRQGCFTRIHCQDELLFDYAEKHRGRSEVVLSPDPVEAPDAAAREDIRRELNIPLHVPLIGSLGVIDERKGNALLLKAFPILANQEADSPHLLLAGPHHERIKAMLSAEPIRHFVASAQIHSVDRFLTTSEMAGFAAACDVIAAPYPAQSGRSSIILWASAAGVPAVGPAWGCIGHVIEKEGLGYTCNVLNPQELADTLIKAATTPWTDEDSRRSTAYARFHRPANFQDIASSLLRRRLGVANGPTSNP